VGLSSPIIRHTRIVSESDVTSESDAAIESNTDTVSRAEWPNDREIEWLNGQIRRGQMGEMAK